MRTNPEISIIVPVLNEERCVEETLKCIARQKTKIDYEIIVSDNGSVDKSKIIAKKYADKLLDCKERGIGAARHFGALNADKKSKYLVFIDADTKIPANYIAYVYKKFSADKTLYAFSTAFEFSESSGKIKLAEAVANKYFMMRDRLRSTTLPGFNTCVRKKEYFKCGGYKNIVFEDVDFSRRINALGKVKYFPDTFVINSPRRLESMGLLRTLYYYAKHDLSWEINSVLIDKFKTDLGLANIKKYVAVRKR